MRYILIRDEIGEDSSTAYNFSSIREAVKAITTLKPNKGPIYRDGINIKNAEALQDALPEAGTWVYLSHDSDFWILLRL